MAVREDASRPLMPRAPAVRRLWPADRAAVLDYFRRLDPETRADRFMGQVGAAGVAAYAAQALAADGAMYGVVADGALRGVGELRPMGPHPSRYLIGSTAEAAFAVERAYRRRGIGAALFARIVRAARNRGVSDLRVRCLSRNGPMLRLAARQGADLRREGIETDGALRIPRATPLSLWYEGVAEAFDYTLSVSLPRPAANAA